MQPQDINQLLAKVERGTWVIFPESEDEFDQKIRRINERIDKFIKDGCIMARNPQTPPTSSPGSWSEQ